MSASESDSRLLESWRSLGAVCLDERLSRADHAVMFVVVDRIGKDGTSWPSLNRVAADAKLDRSTVVRSIARLVEFGHLERESGDRERTNRYRLGKARCEDAPRCDAAPTPRCDAAPSVGAGLHLEVGAYAHLEPTQLTYPIEPTQNLDSFASLTQGADEPMSAKTVKKARKQKPAADLSSIVLPDWLPEKTWGEFVEHRQQMRKPLTMLAATKTIAQFERYRDAGHDPVAIIDTSIANGWQGVFEPKTSAPHSRNLSVVERVAAAIQDRRQRESLAERSERKLREGDARDRLAAQGNVIEGAFTPVGPGYVPRETRSDAELMAEMKRRRPFMSSVTDEGKVYTGTPDEESPDSLTADWP